MSASTKEDEEEQKWQIFVEIGNTIQDMHSLIRPHLAHAALTLVKGFNESHFHIKNVDRLDQFVKLLPKIGEYLDPNPIIIKTAVGKHLEVLHAEAGLAAKEWNGVTWHNKQSGIQTGFSCVVYRNTSRETRYFVKTHQYGPTSDCQQGTGYPNLKEVFIYKLLQHIGIGPEAHFVFPYHASQSALYIVTKEVKLLLLSELTPEAANKTALLQIDLISQILRIRDCGTNPSNCGQVGEKPMIVDFLIETQPGGYSNPDILEKFYNWMQFNYREPMKSAVVESNDFKLSVVKKSLLEWNLLANIDKAIDDSNEVKRMATYSGVKFEDDLAKYVEGIKKTIEVLEVA